MYMFFIITAKYITLHYKYIKTISHAIIILKYSQIYRRKITMREPKINNINKSVIYPSYIFIDT